MNAQNKLPRFRLDMQQILIHAEDIPIAIPYDSDIRGQGYIAEPERLLILTRSKGYLLLNRADIDTMISELKNIEEDMQRRR